MYSNECSLNVAQCAVDCSTLWECGVCHNCICMRMIDIDACTVASQQVIIAQVIS